MPLPKGSDAVIFSYPVYTFLAPSQLHRFIELMKANGVDVGGKIATQISTSKHFYDVTARKYVEENAHDLGLCYIRGLSADMEDLLSDKGRREAEQFFDRFLWAAENRVFEQAPAPAAEHVSVPATCPESTGERTRKMVIKRLRSALVSLPPALRAASLIRGRRVCTAAERHCGTPPPLAPRGGLW